MRNVSRAISLFSTLPGAILTSAYATPVTATYDKPGITFQTEDQRFKVNVHARFQFRYATPDDSQPLLRDDYDQEQGTEFGVNRSRLKIKGHAYKRWLRFSMEYDLNNNYLLDYRFRMEKYDALKVKLGQWKLEYSRERSISSGGQQMLDRSIINRHFTIDRHQAVSVYGHIKSGDVLDFNYWAGIGTGTGRGSNQDDDSQPLYFGRIQWNALGGGVGFVASDLSASSQPRLSFAYAAATNRSRYTRFSSSGGGNLTGFDAGEPGQFEITQFNIDGAFQYAGLSAQAEYHEKTITDRFNNNLETDLTGYYVQAGYFFHQLVAAWPEHLELAGRYARYEPESVTDKTQTEYAVAANYFIQGHKNKITVDATYFEQSQALLTDVGEWRYRLQWDVSF